VKFAVTIQEQLLAISQSQVQNGAVVGPAFATIWELVARHGRPYTIRPLPRGRWSHEPQACYANALHTAIAQKWVYVEGFAIPNRAAWRSAQFHGIRETAPGQLQQLVALH
jgi:hypothetical protein